MTMQPYQAPGTPALNFGQTQLDPGDFIPPRVKIVQQMSDEAQGGKEARATPGDFWNTLTSENLGNDLRFIPIMPFKQRILLVRSERRPLIEAALAADGIIGDLSEGDGLKCRSFDMQQGIGEPGMACAECPLSKWDGNKPPLCSETYNMAALTELGDLIILGFQKSSAKVGKKLFSMTRLTPAAPWSKVYRVATHSEKNDKGTFYVPEVSIADPAVPPELMKVARGWAEQLGGIVIDVSPTLDEDEPAASTSDF